MHRALGLAHLQHDGRRRPGHGKPGGLGDGIGGVEQSGQRVGLVEVIVLCHPRQRAVAHELRGHGQRRSVGRAVGAVGTADDATGAVHQCRDLIRQVAVGDEGDASATIGGLEGAHERRECEFLAEVRRPRLEIGRGRIAIENVDIARRGGGATFHTPSLSPAVGGWGTRAGGRFEFRRRCLDRIVPRAGA